MPTIELEFNHVNQSVQVGDIAYYATTSSNSGFDVAANNITQMGAITAVNGYII